VYKEILGTHGIGGKKEQLKAMQEEAIPTPKVNSSEIMKLI